MGIGTLLLLSTFVLRGHAQSTIYTNLVFPGSGPPSSFIVATGQLAKVVCANISQYGQLSVSIGGSSFTFGSQSPPSIAGPAIITVGNVAGVNSGPASFCTLELVSPCPAFTPSSAVVIPADSGGPVNIVLESSVDLITWNAALPGTYGTFTTNRFFRVRAVRQ
jgi:hypothetical protein